LKTKEIQLQQIGCHRGNTNQFSLSHLFNILNLNKKPTINFQNSLNIINN